MAIQRGSTGARQLGPSSSPARKTQVRKTVRKATSKPRSAGKNATTIANRQRSSRAVARRRTARETRASAYAKRKASYRKAAAVAQKSAFPDFSKVYNPYKVISKARGM